MRIVLDTNIYISAAITSGLSQEILGLAGKTNLFTLLTSEEVLEELKAKHLSKYDRSEIIAGIFIERIKKIAEIVEVSEKVEIIKRDPDDNKILECALAGKADLIVTTDQDLIKLKTFKGIGIIHPRTLSWTFPEYFKKTRRK